MVFLLELLGLQCLDLWLLSRIEELDLDELFLFAELLFSPELLFPFSFRHHRRNKLGLLVGLFRGFSSTFVRLYTIFLSRLPAPCWSGHCCRKFLIISFFAIFGRGVLWSKKVWLQNIARYRHYVSFLHLFLILLVEHSVSGCLKQRSHLLAVPPDGILLKIALKL